MVKRFYLILLRFNLLHDLACSQVVYFAENLILFYFLLIKL